MRVERKLSCCHNRWYVVRLWIQIKFLRLKCHAFALEIWLQLRNLKRRHHNNFIILFWLPFLSMVWTSMLELELLQDVTNDLSPIWKILTIILNSSSNSVPFRNLKGGAIKKEKSVNLEVNWGLKYSQWLVQFVCRGK